MKVTNWRRKLAASLVAGGLMAPGAVFAQALNTQLITNGGFEMVGAGMCCYSATEVLNWTDGTQTGFAYTYGQGYDAGGPLAGGGTYYFTSNADNGIADVNMPGQVSQNINPTGAVAAQIASGEAAVKYSAYFTSYDDDGDIGNLHIEFLNAHGTSFGSTVISASDPTMWKQETGVSFVPVGTTRLRTSVYGTSMQFGPDGYIDQVDVQVTQAANELLFVEVNTTSGQVSIKNQTGDPVHLDYYEIKSRPIGDYSNNGVVDAADYAIWRDTNGESAVMPNDSTPGTVNATDYTTWRANFGKTGSAFNATTWNSLQEQNLAGFPAGNGTGNGWEQAGGSNAATLSESFLTGNSLMATATTLNLGPAFVVGSPQTLEFRYGVVADDGMGNFVGPGTLLRGFVRYVTSGGGTTTVPEPSSVLLVGIGLATLGLGHRSKNRN